MKRRTVLYGLLAFIMSLTLIFAGACAKTATVKGGAEQEPAAQKESVATPESQKVAPEGGAVKSKSKAEAGKMETYVVKKGDCLWTIAKKKMIYNDPFLWPLIYDANKGKIKKAKLIYPGQKLKIPRSGITMDAIKDARKKAGAKKPYLPPKAAVVPKD